MFTLISFFELDSRDSFFDKFDHVRGGLMVDALMFGMPYFFYCVLASASL